jgi:hypothetical protein
MTNSGSTDFGGGTSVAPGSEPSVLDPCSASSTFSIERFVFFTLVFLTMVPGSLVLFILLGDRPYGIQFASMVAYTAAVVLYTFARNRGLQRYLFDCPFVRRVLPRLALRHVVFLIALFVLETLALQLRPHLPAFWLVASSGRRSMPPFTMMLFILCGCLALAQIISNRAILDRAHREQVPGLYT